MRMFAVLACPLLLGAAAPRAPSLSYELRPELTDGAITSLRVTARFTGDPSGTTTFDWTPNWAGEKHLGQWARDLTVVGASAVEPAPHGGRVIHAAPNASLTVSYRIVSAFEGDPNVDNSRQAMPVVRPTWFYAVGEALFAVPVDRLDDPVTFRWTGPAGIGFASDLEHAAASPAARGKSVGDVLESVVIGGRELRIVSGRAEGAPLRVATVGTFAFQPDALARLAQGVVSAERGFWRSNDRQPFLVTGTPVAAIPGHRGLSGTGRRDAFALWIDGAAGLDDLRWLLAHEYFHTWNARRLGRMGLDGPEAESYWLSEGFTDFYARRLMLRAGLTTPEAFAAKWNEALAAYGSSHLRTASNAEAAKLYWDNHEAQRLPYQRGAMLAALWDWRMRSIGRGRLDDVLRDQRTAVGRSPSVPALVAAFRAAAGRHGLDVQPDVARYLERGEPLILPPDAFGRCAAVETIVRPLFERGYDVQATVKAGNVVTGLDAGSPAYAAGLRDGMKILRRTAGVNGDSLVDFELVVQDRSGERTIRFRPAGAGTETIQRIALDPARFSADPVACAKELAG